MQLLQARLEGESQAIRLEFASLVISAEREMTQQNFTHQDMIRTIIYYDSSLKSEFDSANSIPDVFIIANNFWSFFNYDLLEYIISSFQLVNANAHVQQYKTSFQEYCKRRLYECPSKVGGAHNDTGKRVVLKLDDRMNLQQSTMQDLRSLQYQVSKVTGLEVMQLLRIEEGSLKLVYRVPHNAIERINFLSQTQRDNLAKIGVLKISCEKKIVKWMLNCHELRETLKDSFCVRQESLCITELIEYEVDIELALRIKAGHLQISAAVKVRGDVSESWKSDKIQVKVTPTVHHGKTSRTLPLKTVSNQLCSFEINDVVPAHEIVTARDTDKFEFYNEIHIQVTGASASRRLSLTTEKSPFLDKEMPRFKSKSFSKPPKAKAESRRTFSTSNASTLGLNFS